MDELTGGGLRLFVLGNVEATRDGEQLNLGGEKQRAVLAMLIAAGGDSVDRDALIEGIWGEDATDANRRSLHTYVSNLRGITGAEISRSGSTYRLLVDLSAIDVFDFEDQVATATDRLSTDPAESAVILRSALALWRGRPYANVSDAPGMQQEIRRLEELRLAAVELRVDAGLADQRHGQLVPELESLVAEHPFRERFRAQHMLALYGAGRQADALRSYRAAGEALAEIGLQPTRELADLELRILQQDSTLVGGTGATVTERRAFLFTDIEASTRHWDTQPDAMGRALGRHDELLARAVADASGRIFKHTGDGVLAVFANVAAAVTAAEAAQRSLGAESWNPLDELRVRMAVDVGDVDVRDHDFFGPPLNRCARIMGAGHGGQVLLSGAAQDELGRAPIEGVQVRYLGEHRLRGLGDVERIGQLVFIGLPSEFPELRLHVPGPDPLAGEPGDTIRGYELRERLGVGTFGVVYRAYQPSVGREVAIKVIRPEFANHPGFIRRFETEARLVARLEHPHIVPLFDFWRDESGAYLVMRLIPGGTLEPMLGVRWEAAEALRVLGQVGGALDAAHRLGVVHRDFKPANILLDESRNAYLADFGIAARVLEPATGSSASAGERFRAPEASAGSAADVRADIFGLGVLAHELLTGARHDSASSAGDRLAAVIGRATASLPDDRPPSVTSFLEELAQAVGGVEAVEPDLARSVTRNPYKGLRAFTESDAADFRGRAALTDTLVAAVQRHGFVTVVGPSGSGKSSVVAAGLVPELRAGALEGSSEWLYTSLLPGSDPLAALSLALQSISSLARNEIDRELRDGPGGLRDIISEVLAGLDDRVVLAIDQFEELYTATSDADRQAFLDHVLDAVDGDDARLTVIATLRADFFDRPLHDDRLGPLVAAGQVTVIPPTRAELAEAIEAPARGVGLLLEPGLSARIAADVAGQPGGLPLLQYALAEMVDGRSSDMLTAAEYERVGGITGALARRAEQVYLDTSPLHREAVREVFLRLVTVAGNAEDSRRRSLRSELESLDLPPGAVAEILESFGRRRLLTFDRDPTTRSPTVEVAHEALLGEWQRLRSWIDAERGGLVLGRRYRQATAEWLNAGRSPSYLLRGDRLAPFRDWSLTASLTVDEQAFLDESRRADEKETMGRRRRRRLIAAVMGVATAVSVAFGLVAAGQRNSAVDARAEAEAQTLAAEDASAIAYSRELALQSVVAENNDPELSMLLAMESLRVAATSGTPVPEAAAALHRSVQNQRILQRIDGGGFVAVDVSSGLIATASPEGGVGLWDSDSGAQVGHLLRDGTSAVLGAGFSRDGSLLAVLYGGDSAPLSIWDVASKDRTDFVGPPNSDDVPGYDVSWSRDDSQVVTAVDTGHQVWDVASAQPTYLIQPDGNVQFHPTSDLLIAADADLGAIRAFDASTGAELPRLAEPAITPQTLSISPSGDMIAVLSSDQAAIALLDADSGEELSRVSVARPNGHISWAPDGSFVAFGGDSGVIHLVDATSGGVSLLLFGHTGNVWSTAVLDAERIITAGLHDESTLVWDARPGLLPEVAITRTGAVRLRSFAYLEDGSAFVVFDRGPAPGEGVVSTIEAGTTYAEPLLEGQVIGGRPETHIASGGTLIATSEADGGSTLVSASSGETVYQAPFGLNVIAARNRLVLLAARTFPDDPGQPQTEIVDLSSGTVIVALAEPHVASGGFSPDGSLVFTWAGEDTVYYDTTSGSELFRLAVNNAAFHPTDSALIVIDTDGVLRLASLDALEQGRDLEAATTWSVKAHDAFTPLLTVDPSGTMIMTGGIKEPVRIWDMATGTLVTELDSGLTTGSPRGAFHPFLPHVTLMSDGGSLLTFTLDTEELMEIAGASVTRTLTDAECRTYLHLEECPNETR